MNGMWKRLGLHASEIRRELLREDDVLSWAPFDIRNNQRYARHTITFQRIQRAGGDLSNRALLLLLESEYHFVIESMRESVDSNPCPIKTIGNGLEGWVPGVLTSSLEIVFLELEPVATPGGPW